MSRKKPTQQEAEQLVLQACKAIGVRVPTNSNLTHFDEATLEQLKECKDLMSLDDEPWNECPGNAAFVEFMEQWPGKTVAHGYIVSADREDFRLNIEGLMVIDPDPSRDFLDAWTDNFHFADEFSLSYCWYD